MIVRIKEAGVYIDVEGVKWFLAKEEVENKNSPIAFKFRNEKGYSKIFFSKNKLNDIPLREYRSIKDYPEEYL